jgi:single-strand DNA-binding protein
MRQATFAGRLGKDAELKYTPQGVAVCNFNIAVDAGYGENKKTLWIQAAIWRERAEKLSQYLTKGKFVTVSGDVDVRAWVNKNTGDAACQLTVNVDKLTLGPGGEKQQGSSNTASDSEFDQRPNPVQPNPTPASSGGPITDDDIPF